MAHIKVDGDQLKCATRNDSFLSSLRASRTVAMAHYTQLSSQGASCIKSDLRQVLSQHCNAEAACVSRRDSYAVHVTLTFQFYFAFKRQTIMKR